MGNWENWYRSFQGNNQAATEHHLREHARDRSIHMRLLRPLTNSFMTSAMDRTAAVAWAVLVCLFILPGGCILRRAIGTGT